MLLQEMSDTPIKTTCTTPLFFFLPDTPIRADRQTVISDTISKHHNNINITISTDGNITYTHFGYRGL